MSRVFIDSNVPMYAAGMPHRLREPSRSALPGSCPAAPQFIRNVRLLSYNTPVRDEDIHQARVLAERYPRLSPRDLIHVGVMVHAEVQEIVTADAGFDEVHEVRRIDPMPFLQGS